MLLIVLRSRQGLSCLWEYCPEDGPELELASRNLEQIIAWDLHSQENEYEARKQITRKVFTSL